MSASSRRVSVLTCALALSVPVPALAGTWKKGPEHETRFLNVYAGPIAMTRASLCGAPGHFVYSDAFIFGVAGRLWNEPIDICPRPRS